MSKRKNLVATLRKLAPEKVLDGVELCPACDSLSPALGFRRGAPGEIEEYIMHCELCRDASTVTIEEATVGGRRCRKNPVLSEMEH